MCTLRPHFYIQRPTISLLILSARSIYPFLSSSRQICASSSISRVIYGDVQSLKRIHMSYFLLSCGLFLYHIAVSYEFLCSLRDGISTVTLTQHQQRSPLRSRLFLCISRAPAILENIIKLIPVCFPTPTTLVYAIPNEQINCPSRYMLVRSVHFLSST